MAVKHFLRQEEKFYWAIFEIIFMVIFCQEKSRIIFEKITQTLNIFYIVCMKNQKIKFYKTKRYGKYSITVKAVESWNEIQKKLKDLQLRDLSPNKTKTIASDLYLK